MATGDWTFLDGNWGLETGFYVSSPSCLSLRESDTGIGMAWYDGETAIREGSIETSFRTPINGNASLGFLIRSQDNTARKSCYWIWSALTDTVWHWEYIDGAGSNTPIEATMPGWDIDNGIWYRVRVTWCEGRNLQNVLATALRVDQYTGGAWVNGTTYYDTNRRFESSGTNMVALYAATNNNPNPYFDDTKIYKA